MLPTTSRKDVLDLLARGKINVDEAVELLEQSKASSEDTDAGDLLQKKESAQKLESNLDFDIEIEEEKIESLKVEEKAEIDKLESPTPPQAGNGDSPRWLRIRVGNLETGKNKVAVNIPFSMVKFGLGIARFFSQDKDRLDLDAIEHEMAVAEGGILVDVEDEESNEHVRIFFE